MALKKLLADLSIISNLGTNPGIDDGLSEEQLKAKFDEAANIIKDYLNNYLILEIEKTVDVESLLSNILDVTLSKKDKAANALATGDAIRCLRSFFEKVVHGGDYVLDVDGKLAAEISGSATIRVMGGEGVMLGNLFALNIGAYENVELLDGTYGLRRNDLIVVRCTKDETNALSYALVGLTGKQTSGEPVDPEYTQSDINADGTVRDFPLYRVKFDGYDISEIIPLFKTEKSIELQAKSYVDSKMAAVSVALPVGNWLGNTQTVKAAGVLADNTKCHVIISPSESSREPYSDAAVRCTAQGDNSLVFTCDDVPTTDISVNVLILL